MAGVGERAPTPRPCGYQRQQKRHHTVHIRLQRLQKLLAKQYFDIARMSTRPLENEELSAFIRQSYQLAARLAEKED